MRKRRSAACNNFFTFLIVLVLLSISIVGVWMLIRSSTPEENTNTQPTPSAPVTPSPSDDPTTSQTPSTTPVVPVPQLGTNQSQEQIKQRIAEIDAILNDPYMVLVNVDNGLTREYAPAVLVDIQDKKMEKTAVEHLEEMLDAADDAGLDTIIVYSAYRDYTKQEVNYTNKVNSYLNNGYSREDAERKAAEIVNPPGKSEHQTGLATDICTAKIVNYHGNLNEAFADEKEYAWLYEHCAEYGFILRYPEDKVDITGISFEPWHYRYVGEAYAKEIMSKKLCLEEYVAQLKQERATLQSQVGE